MILTEQQKDEIKNKSLQIIEDLDIVIENGNGKITEITLKKGDYVEVPSFILPIKEDESLIETDSVKEQIAIREQYIESVKRALRNTLSAENIQEVKNARYNAMGGTVLSSNVSSNGETSWVVFLKEEDAVKCAINKVKNLLKDDCSAFTEEFVIPYIELIDKDMALRIQTEVKLARMTDDEIVQKAGLYKEYSISKEQNNYSTLMSIVEQSKNKCKEDITKEVDTYLANDPIGFYRSMGYSGCMLSKLPFFELDIDSATDGILKESSTEEILDELDGEVQIVEDVKLGEKYLAYGVKLDESENDDIVYEERDNKDEDNFNIDKERKSKDIEKEKYDESLTEDSSITGDKLKDSKCDDLESKNKDTDMNDTNDSNKETNNEKNKSKTKESLSEDYPDFDLYLIGDEKKKSLTFKESINDKNLFKCVFIAGGPGSGKSYLTRLVFGVDKSLPTMSTPFGVKILNSDYFFENLLTKHSLPHTIADPEKNKVTYKQQMDLRAYAKTLRDKKAVYFIDGMLPIIIDGTGKDYKKITKQANALKAIGYDVSMLFINTSLEVALKRNKERARTVNPSLVEKMWKSVQQNLGKFQNYFGRDNFVLVDNNETLETPQEKKDFSNNMYKVGKNMIEKPLKNPRGKHVIKTLKEIGGKYYSDYLDCIGSTEDCSDLVDGSKEGN